MSEKILFSWPNSEEGQPLTLITCSIEETVPTAKYANTRLFMSTSRYVEDSTKSKELDKTYEELEEVFASKRDAVIESLEEGNK